MDKLTSIMVVVDPADDSRPVVGKAMILARHFHARLELFLCGPAGERFLDAIRRTLAEDVQVSTHVACDGPLYEAIVRRVRESHPDLVIKGTAAGRALRRFALDASDWQLARACPVALMLTRGRPWNAKPRFGAAVDVSDPDSGALARSILETAGFFAGGCKADLEVVFASPPGLDGKARARQADSFSRLVNEFSVGHGHATILQGAAEDTLPPFAASRNFDAIVMGALTRRRGLAALVGTLTSRLVDALECDFVLVKPAESEWLTSQYSMASRHGAAAR